MSMGPESLRSNDTESNGTGSRNTGSRNTVAPHHDSANPLAADSSPHDRAAHITPRRELIARFPQLAPVLTETPQDDRSVSSDSVSSDSGSVDPEDFGPETSESEIPDPQATDRRIQAFSAVLDQLRRDLDENHPGEDRP